MNRRVTTALGAVIGVCAFALSAAPAQADAARSTQLVIHNDTDCNFRPAERGGSTGIFITPFAESALPASQTRSIYTESDGIFSGLDKWQSWASENCSSAVYNSRSLRLHWVNPYVGSNHWDSAGTDAAFQVDWSGGGGDNSVLHARISEST
ncbi:hypothetical protein FZ103_10250 [Streptomonospora sp. PA3]|uniref:hypothetical protein n=1 Tax=Streptomonospora sp. PA3 TaxID=2607326 RepID=UPI0012DE5406|nr:hypothetical protein [Streptomonospora sp. PA3]MUL41552.1 hypothetical protein [Streptomonospora sp. PA3]